MTIIPKLNSNGAHWQASWYDRLGKRQRLGLGKKSDVSERAARKQVQLLAIKLNQGSAGGTKPQKMTLAEWAEKYQELRAADVDERTMMLHRHTLELLCEHLGAGVQVSKLTRVDFAEWQAAMATLKREDGKTPRYSEVTIAAHGGRAKTVFEVAVDLELLDANPAARLKCTPPKMQREFQILDDASFQKIIDACPGPAWRCLFRLCREGGLRRGEALGLQWAHVNWTTKLIDVWPKARKKSNKQRFRRVPMVPSLYDELLAAHEAGIVAPCEGIRTGNIHREAEAILTKAGVPVYAKPFHTLRKNRDTELLADPTIPVMDVAQWQGHSAEVAREHYHASLPATIEKVTKGGGEKGNQ